MRWKNLYRSPVIFRADACWPDNPTGDTVVTEHGDHMSFNWQAAAPPHMLPSGFRPAERFSMARYSCSLQSFVGRGH